ncbi:MAG: hypothetical protein DMH00_02380 [Acidobacteria bacterium]|nr:MAG: hypothetical protein DMH00_02380 [Acidobacteriota bacterium]
MGASLEKRSERFPLVGSQGSYAILNVFTASRSSGGAPALSALTRANVVLLLLSVPGLLLGAPEPSAQKVEETAPSPVNSPWKTWQFNAPPERVRAELLVLMKEDRLNLKEESRKDGTLLTDLVEFNDKKFGVDVSIPPPKATPKYPWFQTNEMRSGRYGLEAKLSPLGSTSTRVDLRALLQIRGMDGKIRAMRWIPRYSNGAVEQQYFTRLSLRLLPSTVGDNTRR